MTSGTFQNLPIHEVQLDVSNPRIRRFLENFKDNKHDDNRIGLALNAQASDNPSAAADATTPARLRESIIANGGIRQPIIVNQQTDGTLVCIEGNTRLWIYRDLEKRGATGDWSTIPALVHSSLGSEDLDAIRLQAHLVGPRPWDAYSKAKYLSYLQNKELMPLDRIVALCGGNQRDIVRSIQAYADMETYYRPLCGPQEFEPERFSGFVEYQSPRVQQAILEAGYSGDEFAGWIKDKRIKNLADVRQVPEVLKNEKAREVFLKKGMKEAVKVLDKPDTDIELGKASLEQLASALQRRAGGVSIDELRSMKEDGGSTLRHVEAAIDTLTFLQSQLVSEA